MKRVVLDTNIIISSALGGALVFVLVKLIEKIDKTGLERSLLEKSVLGKMKQMKESRISSCPNLYLPQFRVY